jgi:hypothetical protein
MARIKLGARPKHFSRVITVSLPEGGKGTIEVSYVYRTRSEFGQFVDEMVTAAGTKPPASQDGEDVKFSLQQALERTRDTNADYIMKIMQDWDLDAEFSRASVVQLCDELPGAALEIIEQYRLAITEGRLGN